MLTTHREGGRLSQPRRPAGLLRSREGRSRRGESGAATP
jgi:hypothetical protein